MFEVGCVIDNATNKIEPIYQILSNGAVEKIQKRKLDFLVEFGISQIQKLGCDSVNEMLNQIQANRTYTSKLNKKSKLGG